MQLDKFDFALLEHLQKDCLTPLRELADLVHLSTASVQRRIQKLRDSGYIIGNTAVLDPDKLGQVITIFVEVRVNQTHVTDLDELKASFSSQVNEIHARIAVLNKFTELGRPHTQVVT
jgi:Lrp/AsnC family transcriptional regulator, leucine-responsive regulatory protein